ncbi:MAG: aldehyde dehydrogenase [Clostridia bacterium]|nr:aldehyde dehydrogenase [Clostridia bacterium]
MDYERILSKQRAFFESGKTKEYSFRIRALKALRDSMEYYEDDIKAALKSDLNKAPTEVYLAEYSITIQHINHALRALKKWMRPKAKAVGINGLPGRAYEMYDPFGIVLIMSPWNYPIQLTMGPLIGAIAAGNCCVVKPSAYSPASSEIMAKIISRAFPPEYVTTVQGGRAENNLLLDQRFDYIFFTGSVNVGKLAMEKASKHLTPVTLELGGKSPCIVTSDASIKRAARNIAFGKLLNAGQTCVGPDYVLVAEELKDEFCAELERQIKLMIGDALSNDDYPRIVNEKHFDRLLGLLEGVTVYSGGKSDRAQLKIEPTILVDVAADSPVMGEEIFGPLLPVIPVKSLDEAERFVLNGEKPLALYLFTTSRATEKRVLIKLSSGGACINDTIIHIMCKDLCFGGVGSSGMGLYHGEHGFKTFSHTKGVYKKFALADMPFRYHPYTDFKCKATRFLMK